MYKKTQLFWHLPNDVEWTDTYLCACPCLAVLETHQHLLAEGDQLLVALTFLRIIGGGVCLGSLAINLAPFSPKLKYNIRT